MKLRSMEEKISYRLFLMGFLGLLFTAALCIFVFHKAFTAQAWTSLEREADLVSAGYDLVQDPQQLSSFVTNDLRITLISQDGSVLFESATDQPMENHLSRPEIRQAMTEGVGRDIRDSQTMGYETYYYAVLLPNGEILRMAQDAETVWSIYDSTLPAIVLSCVALMLAAAVLAALLTRALVSPVLSMTEDLDHIQDNVPYKELVPFAESIHSDRILRENNEKMRQEFTANVSHELKTPLTSISGYAELIETGIAKPEDVPGFAQKIHVEMAKLRRRIETDPKRLEKLVRKLNKSRFTLSGEQFKRPKGDVGKLLNPWYNAKNIAVGYDDNPEGVLFTPELKDEVLAGFRELMPLYLYLDSLAGDPEPNKE